MTTLQRLAEHDAFMKWFQAYYPHLYKMYGHAITPATNDSGFVLHWKRLNRDIASMLSRIISDYLYLMKKTA